MDQARQLCHEVTHKKSPSADTRRDLQLAQQQLKQETRKARNQQWGEWCDSLSTMNTTQLWSNIKKLRGSNAAPKDRNPQVKAEQLAASFVDRSSSAASQPTS